MEDLLQRSTQDEYDLRAPFMILPALTAPLLSLFLSFQGLVSRSDNAYRHNADTTRQPYAPSLTPL